MAEPAAPAVKPKRKLSIARVVVWGSLAFLVGVYFAMRSAGSGKSISSAITGPTTLADERVQLKEGQWKGYGVALPTARKVEIHVTAGPKAVDVVTVAKSDYDQFTKAQQSLFGGKFQYVPALSSQRVTKYDGQGILAQGEWYVVVMRPQESLLFGDDTNAQVRILGY